jgi:hypothetical protein
MADKEQQFQQMVAKIIADIEKVDGEAVQRALDLLDQTRRDIIAEIAQGGQSEFTFAVKQHLQSAIEARIEQFRRDLGQEMQEEIQTGFELGAKLVDEPSQILTSTLISVNKEAVQVAASFSAELIGGLTDELRNRINAVLRQAVLGNLSTMDTIKQIGASLNSAGPFKSIAARAENIMRTEVLRIQAIATQARMQVHAQQVKNVGFTLLKQWLTSDDDRVRLTHVLAGLTYGRDGTVGPIAVEEKFVVGFEEALYPREASLSAQEACNCRCVASPVLQRAAA